MKNEKGITLIALVITIILMLVLAGIVINLAISKNGIFEIATKAKEEHKIASIKEKVELEILDLDTIKVANGEKLTVEQALVEIQTRKIFEEIDLTEKTGICEGYIINLGYNEDGKVVILGIEKDTGVRLGITVNPTGYTNGNVEVGITLKSSNAKVTNLEVPEGMVKKKEGLYEVSKNGTYLVKATLDNGESIEKEIKIATIDRLAPKEFTITTEEITNGFKIKAQTEDENEKEGNVKSGISHYEYYVNGEKKESNEITRIAQGTYSVYVVAFDKAGNNTKSDEIQVTITRKISKIAAGLNYSLAIDENGNIWSWGDNEYGKLGTGSSTTNTIPTQIKIEVKFKEITTGIYHSLAIDENGNIWSWGRNNYGQLGDGTKADCTTPTKIQTEVKFKQIACGYNHSLAIDENGNIWSWGRNYYGQLGDGTKTDCTTPTKIEIEVKFKQIACGHNHNLAIDEEGNIWSWGRNYYGQLGDGTKTDCTTPTKIQTEVKFKQIACGYKHSLAIDENGNIWSWGRNNYGQLGDGTKTDCTIPTKIQTEVKFKAIAAKYDHSLAIDQNSNLWGCGTNSNGQLGDGDTVNHAIPIKIETEVKFKTTVVGDDHGLAIDENGSIWSWGRNYYGQLGGSITSIPSPPIQVLF